MQSTVILSDLDQTVALAEALSVQLGAGDTLFLQGPVGAGKTALARAIIQGLQSRFDTVEEVPSPTFTLVQTYVAGALEIWHADLYRLTMLDELFELGLIDAMDTALVLVEWPERMGELLPSDGLMVRIELGAGDDRQVIFDWSDPKWTDKISAMNKALQSHD